MGWRGESDGKGGGPILKLVLAGGSNSCVAEPGGGTRQASGKIRDCDWDETPPTREVRGPFGDAGRPFGGMAGGSGSGIGEERDKTNW